MTLGGSLIFIFLLLYLWNVFLTNIFQRFIEKAASDAKAWDGRAILAKMRSFEFTFAFSWRNLLMWHVRAAVFGHFEARIVCYGWRATACIGFGRVAILTRDVEVCDSRGSLLIF